MLGTIRKFSSSIYAKVFLLIVAIPFIFWGMGDLFTGGNLNTIVKIGKDKIHKKEFINYLRMNSLTVEQLNDSSVIEKALFNFIGEKLILKEIEDMEIQLSDESLSNIIKNQELFKRENKFSRTEYEKFLIENNYNAIFFEQEILQREKKKQLFNFLGGGIVPSNFLINMSFDKANQKRNIEYINLNEVIKKSTNFSESDIQKYFDQNKDSFKEIYKSVNFLKLVPKNLTGINEYNDLFFKKIDEIDDLIAEGNNLNSILEKFNLQSPKSITINKLGKNKDAKTNNILSKELLQKIFIIDDSEPTILAEHKNEYFIFELTKNEIIQNDINNKFVKDEIFLNLEKKIKRKLIVELIDKINNKKFKKKDFDDFANKYNISSVKIKLNNRNDDKILKREMIDQIYSFGEKIVIVVTDISLSENYLIYIDSIENVSITKNSEKHKQHLLLSKDKIVSELYNTYDSYLKNKYKIDINYKALDSIKNYIR